jgi:hypothetical protein
MVTAVQFLECGSADSKAIEQNIKNKWNWSWCEKVLCEGTPDEHRGL